MWALICLLAMTSMARPATTTDKIAQNVLELTNRARARQHLPLLQNNAALAAAARRHSRHMAQFNFFDHTSPVRGEVDVEDRVTMEGGHVGALSENIYWCRGLADARVAASIYREWMDSSDHREAMLGPEKTLVGIGVFRQGSEYWATGVFSDN